jgi:ubiquinone/menaquinone biosynthesis C-methylase UbiE
MPADASIYDSDRLARCYANDRPALHGAICARLFAAIPRDHNLERAVDIGCGAGASTAALTPYVEHATGIDPFERMLRHARHRYTKATFLQSWAEALPLCSGRFGLVTAAGSLSYMNLDAALSEVSRVMLSGGYFAPYDFNTGRVVPRNSHESACFEAFESHFPWPTGYALDFATLPYQAHGLTLIDQQAFSIEIEMTGESYVQYILSETNVEAAVSGGISERSVLKTCRNIFHSLFSEGPRKVEFLAVIALASKEPTTLAMKADAGIFAARSK